MNTTGHRLASDNLDFFFFRNAWTLSRSVAYVCSTSVFSSFSLFHWRQSCLLLPVWLSFKRQNNSKSYEEILSRFSENVDNLNDRKDCSILVMFWMLKGPLIRDQSQKVFIIIKESIMFVHNLLYILQCLSKWFWGLHFYLCKAPSWNTKLVTFQRDCTNYHISGWVWKH